MQGLSDGGASYNAVNNAGTIQYNQTKTAPATVGDIKIDFNIAIGSGLTNSTSGAFTDAQVTADRPALKSFSIDRQGNVVVSLTNGESFNRGKLLLQNFRDPNGLTKEGNNLFSGLESAGAVGGVALSAANNSPGTTGLGQLQAGTLELSNVDLGQEFADMIIVQRSFQAGSRVITVSDTMLEDVINLKR